METINTTDTPRTDACPYCGAKTWEEDTGFRCGSDYIAPEGEDCTLYRTSTCYANENSQLKAEVERLRADDEVSKLKAMVMDAAKRGDMMVAHWRERAEKAEALVKQIHHYAGIVEGFQTPITK
jgi:hypothetical protein